MDELTLKNVLPEGELCDLLKMNKNQLADLRSKGLAFIRLNRRARLYFEDDLIRFFKTKRVVMDRDD